MDRRRHLDLRKLIDLQGLSEGIRQFHVCGESCQNQVANLNALPRDYIAESMMVVGKELWVVVKQNQKRAQRELVQGLASFRHLDATQVRPDEVQQPHEESMKQQPATASRNVQDPWHEDLVADELQPGEGKVWHAHWIQHEVAVGKSLHDLPAHVRVSRVRVQHQVHEQAIPHTLVESLLIRLRSLCQDLANGLKGTAQQLRGLRIVAERTIHEAPVRIVRLLHHHDHKVGERIAPGEF
mmetsp:Transcript_14315/g.33977  ORF Transcript_14315/g.33977 Transcript_14315/m.33977 type:complete len:240 (+) Transcript_14315:1089-1808(+)